MGRTPAFIISVSTIFLLAVPVDAAPNVRLSSSTVILPVGTKATTAVADVFCTPSSSAPCDCSINPPTVPVNAPFNCWKLSTDKNYKVYFIGTQAGSTRLSSDVTPYYLQINCSDGTGTTTVPNYLKVDILPNRQPILSGYPAVTTSTIDAKNTASGTTVYTLTVTDPENDALSYSMTQKPDSGYFTIGSSDGVIRTAVDMNTVLVDTVICTVSVSDGTNTVTDFFVTIKLSNLNTRPSITNLPATVRVTEDQVGGYTLIALNFADPDTTQTLVHDYSVEPADEDYKFEFEPNTHRLKLASLTRGQKLLDYETTNKYTITCTVFDGYLYSTGDVLTVYVSNINEPPVFDTSIYYCTMPESKPGVSSCHLGLTVTDPEQNTITSVALKSGGNNDLFMYTRSTTILTFNIDYDLDNSKNPTSTVLTLLAVDAMGATGSATIQVTIQDVNDNTCTFGNGGVMQFNLNQDANLQTLGTFVATDADLTSPNNVVTFEVASALPTSSYNYLTVFGNGEVRYVGLIPESEHGKSFSLIVRCKDGGTPSLSATATVLVSYLTTTSSPTTTTSTTTTTTTTAATTTQATNTSIWNDPGFVAVFAILISLLGLLLIAGIWYLCARSGVNFGNICGPEKPPTRVRPVQEYKEDGSRDNLTRQEEPRLSPIYRELAWQSGDHFEHGSGYDGRPLSNIDIFFTRNSGTRALPAPRPDY